MNTTLQNALFDLFSQVKLKKSFDKQLNFLLTALVGDKKLHVMLADDDADDREIFLEALATISANIKVSIAIDGADLMHKLNNLLDHLPDLIFLDLNMPRKNGVECLDDIRRIQYYDQIPVLIYSTSAFAEQINITYKKGANLYIQKPHSFTGIQQVLQKIFSADPSQYLSQPSFSHFVLK